MVKGIRVILSHTEDVLCVRSRAGRHRTRRQAKDVWLSCLLNNPDQAGAGTPAQSEVASGLPEVLRPIAILRRHSVYRDLLQRIRPSQSSLWTIPSLSITKRMRPDR
jgi:hypothetical protein